MAEMRVRTTRHVARVAAPVGRAHQLIARRDDRLTADRLDPGPAPEPGLAEHPTRPVRMRLPETHIVSTLTMSPAVRTHAGTFSLTSSPHAVRATFAHTVPPRRDAVSEKSSVEDLRAGARQIPHGLSPSIPGRAKAFTEARRPIRAGATQR